MNSVADKALQRPRGRPPVTENGYEIVIPAVADNDVEVTVRTTHVEIDQDQPDVHLGSSVEVALIRRQL